ncbi:MAG: nitroreductase family protein [Planctomycetota bacterium]|nr:nitroreductase family protein [Planctomycetota bacterium]MDP6989994.1 nitroreductase family protein [Planctomycetota bacterium]
MEERARAFRREVDARRSVREFSSDPVPAAVIDECLRAAGCAPSGAHQQPWRFVVVTDPELKSEIRSAAEQEERTNYGERMTEEWLHAVEPLGVDASKPFLEVAPALIVVFRQAWWEEDGRRSKVFYSQESVGIATGFLLVALHRAGLVALTHTPSPMGFLERILERPAGERAVVLIPVGYPAEGCEVPDLTRLGLDAIREWR